MKLRKYFSIRLFFLFVIVSLFLIQSFVLYDFLRTTQKNITYLLKENLQVNLLNLNYFLKKNFVVGTTNNVAAFLDNSVAMSKVIMDIHILDNNGKLVYATDRDIEPIHPKSVCVNALDIAKSDIYKVDCFKMETRLFDGLQPYYYTVYFYTDKHYINSILNDQIKKSSWIFILSALFYLLFLWLVFRNLLIIPLEKLRQFAYYSTKEPKKFLIKELESIRYSLSLTFNRLKKEQEELFKLSTQDSLSGLYNRLSLLDKINWLIAKSHRTPLKFALIFLDLDNFKNINDSKGHDFGDKVLKKVAETLLATVRENDIVSRFGGDEFVIVLPDIEDETIVIDVVQRIQQKLSIPFEFDDVKYPITASIGIAIYPKDGHDATTLLKNADIAMYRSKELGKNKYNFFTESLNKTIQHKMRIQKMMISALQNGYFELYYQPKVDIKTNKIIGCEALIRLIDPQEGLIPPNEFIPLAEANNFIIPLGKWIINEVVEQVQRWQNSPLKDLKISFNVSANQFEDSELFEYIQKVTKEIDTSKLDIEITESVLMESMDQKIALINKIKDLGISFSLDDFGTGYSSLSYLKKIPFETIKIDKSFIDDLEDMQDQSFVNMIISIAKKLELEVVAEGVETKEQLLQLQAMQCDLYQGYYCSKPLPADEFEKLFITHKCDA